MIVVNRFQVSSDMQQLFVEVTASDGNKIDSFKISTEKTYNDSKQDLSDKLVRTSEKEIITLTPLDLGLTTFNGIYIAEFESDISGEEGIESADAAACNYTQFFYCINDRLTKVNGDCISCDDNMQNVLLIDLYLEALKMALMTKKYNNAIINYYSLNRLCCGSVDGCVSGCTSGYGILDGSFTLM